MNSEKPLINRVAQSGLVTIDLETFFPKEEKISFDIKDYLFHGLILKEKDFRTAMQEHDWIKYIGKIVVVNCSTDAIIPTWAFMLIATYLQPYAKKIIYGSMEIANILLMKEQLDRINIELYKDKRIIVKGCSDHPVPVWAYVELTAKLQPHVKSIMYGEACSTVPLFKKSNL